VHFEALVTEPLVWMAFLFLFTLAAFAYAAPISFPQYLQCDPKWGNDMMGVAGTIIFLLLISVSISSTHCEASLAM
jgi:hypothetical protein